MKRIAISSSLLYCKIQINNYFYEPYRLRIIYENLPKNVKMYVSGKTTFFHYYLNHKDCLERIEF